MSNELDDIRITIKQEDAKQLAFHGLAKALEKSNLALQRISAHFWKIRPEHLEPSAMMNEIDETLISNRKAILKAKTFLEAK